MSTPKKDDRTFTDMVDSATRNIHSALLEGGAKKMRDQIWLEFDALLFWQKLRLEQEEKLQARRKKS